MKTIRELEAQFNNRFMFKPLRNMGYRIIDTHTNKQRAIMCDNIERLMSELEHECLRWASRNGNGHGRH